MLQINDEFIASHHIISVGAHPTERTICVTLINGRELRVRMEHGMDKHKAVGMLVYRVEEDMLRYGGK